MKSHAHPIIITQDKAILFAMLFCLSAAFMAFGYYSEKADLQPGSMLQAHDETMGLQGALDNERASLLTMNLSH